MIFQSNPSTDLKLKKPFQASQRVQLAVILPKQTSVEFITALIANKEVIYTIFTLFQCQGTVVTLEINVGFKRPADLVSFRGWHTKFWHLST